MWADLLQVAAIHKVDVLGGAMQLAARQVLEFSVAEAFTAP